MSTDTSVPSSPVATSAGGRRLGLSLLVIATAQLMLVLDDTIANIALPSIQGDLSMSASNVPWVVNASTEPCPRSASPGVYSWAVC